MFSDLTLTLESYGMEPGRADLAAQEFQKLWAYICSATASTDHTTLAIRDMCDIMEVHDND